MLSISVEAILRRHTLTTKNCTISQQSAISPAHELGKLMTVSPAFTACINWRMNSDYKPCGSPLDPFFADELPTEQASVKQIYQATRVMGSLNAAPLEVTCAADLAPDEGGMSIGPSGYGDTFEQLKINIVPLNNKIAQGLGDLERGEIADVIWHEAMHQQGYRHPPKAGGTCGYDPTQYQQMTNSVPYITGRCMSSASIHTRLYATNAAGAAESFPPGVYRAAGQGDFQGTIPTPIAPRPAMHSAIDSFYNHAY